MGVQEDPAEHTKRQRRSKERKTARGWKGTAAVKQLAVTLTRR